MCCLVLQIVELMDSELFELHKELLGTECGLSSRYLGKSHACCRFFGEEMLGICVVYLPNIPAVCFLPSSQGL